MAMNRQRRTSNINNIITYDTLGNVTIPASFTVKGLITAGFAKVDANGLFSVDTTIYQAALPSQTGNSGKYLTTNGSTLYWGTIDLSAYVPTSRTIATTSPLVGGGNLSADRTISMPAATSLVDGYLTSTDRNTFNGKQNAITLTTTGISGAATFVGDTLNIPQYSDTNIYTSNGSLTAARTLTLNAQPLTILGSASSTTFFANGNVGIGTIVDAGYKLDVIGPTRIYPRGSGNQSWVFRFTDVYDRFEANGSYVYFENVSSATYSFLSIQCRNGNLQLGASTNKAVYIGSSDYGLSPVIIGSTTAPIESSAILDVRSTTKGVLFPRMTTTQKNAIGASVAGLQVYDSTLNLPSFYDGTAWVDYGFSVYNRNGTLTSDRTISTTTGFKLVLNPKLEVVTTTYNVTAGMLGWSAVNGYVQTTIPASTSFSSTGYAFSSLIGNNYMTYEGAATFAADTFTGGVVGINNFAFTAPATITINQSSSIRTYSAGLFQNTSSGSVNGTITHLSGLAVRPIFRASGSSTIIVTNNYGLLIADQNEYSHATITNRWGVYQEGASDNNYFRGKVIIGTSNTVGSSVLNINGLPTSATGLSTGDIWSNGGVLTVV